MLKGCWTDGMYSVEGTLDGICVIYGTVHGESVQVFYITFSISPPIFDENQLSYYEQRK